VAVRGDQDGTAIRIVKYVDQHGRVHFSGAPVADRQANKRRRTQQAIASRL
jgi:hypothetical protein